MQVKKAFILVNTGSPSELSVGAAKSFLRQFLSDPEVISAPFFIRYPLAYRIASKRAEAYLENLKNIDKRRSEASGDMLGSRAENILDYGC